MTACTIKSATEIKVMAEGGKRLREIKLALAEAAKPGVSGLEIDELAKVMCKKLGGRPSFTMVPGYSHATCININEEVVHGVPTKRVFKPGDVVGIDVGLYYRGFHTDTALTVAIEENGKKPKAAVSKFLRAGKEGLEAAIRAAKPGNSVWHISKAMESVILAAGYSPVKALTGHGVGRELHEEPPIPCFTIGEAKNWQALKPGLVLAIEIMYNKGASEVKYKSSDGWTISTSDGTMSGLFEETVAVLKSGPVVLT